MKFHANPSSGSRPTDQPTDKTKLIVSVRYFANAPKNVYLPVSLSNQISYLVSTNCFGVVVLLPYVYFAV